MKLRLSVLFLFISALVFSQNFHDTQGKLEISNSGQSSYTLPIAMPPSINSVGAIINLVYSSSQLGGVAGQGWSINSISTINRMSTRYDIDGFRDGVDFDDNDKLALDGQRLLLKSGTYWADGSTYETEVQSNTKIELKGSGNSIYFIVTTPDGSRSWYGNESNSTDINSYYITRFEDTNGNFITYHYGYPFNKGLCIQEVRFSANTFTNPSPLNKIVFTYKQAARIESGYIKGVKIEKAELLDKIEVFTSGNLFRKYQVTHTTDGQGYQRVSQLQEFNGNLEPANPVTFEYNQTTDGATEQGMLYTDSLDLTKSPDISGDFDGDSRVDFIASSKMYTKLFDGSGGVVYNLPFSVQGRNFFLATTLSNNKVNQKQSIVKITENLNSIDFGIYNLESSGLINNYTKTVSIDNSGNCSDECNEIIDDTSGNPIPNPNNKCTSPTYIKHNNKFLEGDFNGDGISEVLLLTYEESKVYKSDPIQSGQLARTNSVANQNIVDPNLGQCYWHVITSNIIKEARIIDLNPNSSVVDNSVGNFAMSSANIQLLQLQNEKRFVMDFNSDGKADIIQIATNGAYKVLSFKYYAVSPWAELEIIGEGVIDNYTTSRPLVFGDFNGDSKPDLAIPVLDGSCRERAAVSNLPAVTCPGNDQWAIYYTNPKTTGGELFEKNVVSGPKYYKNYNVDNTDWPKVVYNYYAMDVNKDGKSDLVTATTTLYQYDWFFDPKDIDSSWRVDAHINNIGLNGSFNAYYTSPNSHNNNDNSWPIPLAANYKYQGMESDMLVIRYHQGDSFDKTITYIDFQRDFQKENLLKKVTQSNGALVDEIVYSSTEPNGNNDLGTLDGFYSSTESLQFPYIELKKSPNNWLVSRIKNTSVGSQKFQDFTYHGLVVNNYGLGIIGFIKTARTNWYSSASNKRIWTVTQNNPLQRGATVKTYNQLLNATDLFSFANSNTNLISKTETVFADSTDTISKRYVILLNKQTSTDFLNNIVKEKSYTSYSTDYFLPLSETTNNYLGTTLQGSVTIATDYDTPVLGTGSNYYIGRPKQVTTTATAYGDTQTSVEKYFYTNNNLTRTEKKANNDAVTLVEEFDYFSNGLLKSKTTSATGTTTANAVSARTVSYTYDSTNRFVKTTTDAEGLVTTNNTYDPIYGLVLTQTNPLGLVTTSTYDYWGKPTKVTDFLGKSITTTYTKTGSIYTTTQTGDDGSASVSEADALGRIIRKGAKDFAGNWVYVTTEYDDVGRRLRDSQPYASTASPTQWTSYEYDEYERPIKTTEFTGKIVTTTYSGLTVSVNDSVMTKSKTMNANGHTISATDSPGGTITFKYNATGALTESSYDGVKIITTYDNWGRRITMTDPSAGTANNPGVFNYTYNAYGELLTETTPKGTTTYTLNPVGKPLTKRIVGLTADEKTDILSTYTYDPTAKWLTNIAVTNPFDGNSNYAYTYDTVTKQLKETVETLPYATFTKTLSFDAFGRVDNETTAGTAHNKSSSKTIKHTYKNGMPWQLLDGSTVISQVDTFNVRGQLTGATLGNGMTIANTYDSYGYATETKHIKTGTTPVTVMNLKTTFEPIKGNLITKYCNLLDTNESFTYDNLDRLVSWDVAGQNVLSLPFNTTTDGFTFSGTSTLGSVTNSAGTLKVVLKNTFVYANKPLTLNLTTGNKLRVKADITNKIGTGGVIVNAVMVETDPTNASNFVEVPFGTISNGAFDAVYTVTDFLPNPKLSLRFIIDESSPEGSNGGGATLPNTTFYVDNLKIDNVSVYTQNYDDRGRITQNAVGTYNYNISGKPYQNSSIDPLTPDAQAYYGVRGNLKIDYNAFKAPVQIEELGKDKLNFAYNAMGQRSAMYYGNTNADILQRPYRKYYSADGSMEVKYTTATGAVEFITYIGGTAYSAAAVVKSDGTTQNYFYLHRDYQGSILAITNATGSIVEKRHFDVWGAIIKVQDGAGNNLTGLTFFDRGYTGHEHLQSVGLINMNARLYDPKLHRFLSPDNYIQDPYNTQNYNRYGYCVNNPTKYTDITGNVFGVDDAILIGAGVGLASYFVANLIAGTPITLKGAIMATFIGGFSGAVTFGIGEAFKGLSFALKATYSALSHGAFQGLMSGVQGGGFWVGAASGALSSLAGSAMDALGKSGETLANNCQNFATRNPDLYTVMTLGSGAIMGGVGAELSGGNFWRGAVTGLIVSGLNDLAHSVINNRAKSRLDREVDAKYGSKADSPAPVNESSVNGALELPLLKGLNNASGNQPFTVDAENMYWPEDGSSEAITVISRPDLKNSSITYFKASFASYRILAQHVLHELYHAKYNWMGYWKHLETKYDATTARNISEFYSYRLCNQFAGTPYYGILDYARGAAFIQGMPYSDVPFMRRK